MGKSRIHPAVQKLDFLLLVTTLKYVPSPLSSLLLAKMFSVSTLQFFNRDLTQS